MIAKWADADLINELGKHKTGLSRAIDRPILLFLCGGDDSDSRYVAREMVESYLSENPCGEYIYCMKPEKLLARFERQFANIDLLVIEKLIAEISDAILLFDESPGSLCELGAFAACDPILPMLTAFVPKEYRDGESFAILGPVRHIERDASPLSGVIYGNVRCPLKTIELVDYLQTLREKAQTAKRINNEVDSVSIGSYFLELLDIASIIAPTDIETLEAVYCDFKHFKRKPKLRSDKLGTDAKLITTEMVVCFMAASGLIDYDGSAIRMTGRAPSYFMFNQGARRKIMRARMAYLEKRRRRRRGCDDVRFSTHGERPAH